MPTSAVGRNLCLRSVTKGICSWRKSSAICSEQVQIPIRRSTPSWGAFYSRRDSNPSAKEGAVWKKGFASLVLVASFATAGAKKDAKSAVEDVARTIGAANL